MATASILGMENEARFFTKCAEKAKEKSRNGTACFIIVDNTGQVLSESYVPGSRKAQRDAALAKARSVLANNSTTHLRPPSSYCCFTCLGLGALICCGGMLCVIAGCRREFGAQGAVIIRYVDKGGRPGILIVAASGSLDDGGDVDMLEHGLSSIKGMSKDMETQEWTWTSQDKIKNIKEIPKDKVDTI